jgi:hypothetical protein
VALAAALLQRQKLLSAEGLVVDLRGSLNQILEMGAEEEISQVNEFAVVLVLDVDDTPPVLARGHLLAVDDDGLFGADNGEGHKGLLPPQLASMLLSYFLNLVLTLICVLMARSSSSNSSFSYGYILRLWKANSSLMRSLKA